MDFRTELRAEKSTWDVSHRNRILSVGSCFADFMGAKLSSCQFSILSNPFGIIYNPLSIAENLIFCTEKTFLANLDIVKSKDLYFSYQLHSQLYGSSETELLSKAAKIQEDTLEAIGNADYLLITLGTALVYQLIEKETTVANCHKMGSGLFEKRLLSVEEIKESFLRLISHVTGINNKIKLILSISPVRHLKDTISMNTVSKSVLRLACHQLCEATPEKIQYFPAYEVIMDDLRDYRFYNSDLIHPSEVAQNYVWNKFGEIYFSKETQSLNKEIEEINTALQHRVFYPYSEDYILFKKKMLEKVNNLNVKVPIPRLIREAEIKFQP